MLSAYLMTPGGAKKGIHGVGEQIVIDHDRMIMRDDGPVAVHGRHAWELEGEKFVVMQIEPSVRVRLISGDKSIEHGPYDRLWIVDGLLLSGFDDERAIISFDYTTTCWNDKEGNRWERVVFEELN